MINFIKFFLILNVSFIDIVMQSHGLFFIFGCILILGVFLSYLFTLGFIIIGFYSIFMCIKGRNSDKKEYSVKTTTNNEEVVIPIILPTIII